MNNFLAINYKTKIVTWNVEICSKQSLEEAIYSFESKGFKFKEFAENSQYAHFTKNASEFEIKAAELYLLYRKLKFNLEYRPKVIVRLENVQVEFNKIRNKTFSYFKVLSEKNKLIDVLDRIDLILNLKVEQVLNKNPLNLKIESLDGQILSSLNLEYICYYYEALNQFFNNLTVTNLSELKVTDLNIILHEDMTQQLYNRQHSNNIMQNLFNNIKYDTHFSVSLSRGLI